jgi:hypothetical protein
MNRHFTFTIRDKKFDGYKKLASFLFIINAILFIAWAQASQGNARRLIFFATSGILIFYAVYNWLYKPRKERSYIIIYLLIAVIWITETPYWYAGPFFLLMMFLQNRMESDLVIAITPLHILIAGFIPKKYDWKLFNNIVLKDGLLTLDFMSDRVVQVEPDWQVGNDTKVAANNYERFEADFNEFCKVQLKK